MADFAKYRVLSFDCYGTLIDWETGLLAAAQRWLDAAADKLDAAGFLRAFGRFERETQAAAPATRYPDVLAQVLQRIGSTAGFAVTDADAQAFGTTVGDWPPFPDSHDALAALQRGCKLVILSNVDRASFARSNDRLGITFDRIVTAEDVGAYKPDRRMFEALLTAVGETGLAKEQLLHVGESMHHDVMPANAHGIDVVWIDRAQATGRPRASGAVPPDARPLATFPSMAAFATAFRA